MVLFLILILVFLTGIALFTAVVGSAFLKKHAEKIIVSEEPQLKERDYRERFQRQYEDTIKERERIEQEKRAEVSKEYAIPELREVPVGKIGAGGSAVRWISIILLALVVFILSIYFGYRGYKNLSEHPGLFFSEKIDYLKLRPINKSDTFTRGNVSIFVRSRKPLGLDEVKIDINKIGVQGLEPYHVEKIPLKRENRAFSTRVLFDKVGTYMVSIYDQNGELIKARPIFIVPDTFAYKAIGRE